MGRFARRAWLIAAAIAVGVAAGIAAQAPQRALARQTWTVDGVDRTALVAAPVLPVSQPGAPIVLVFHGHGGTSQGAARSFSLHTHWPEAVVLYPQGLPTPGRLTDPEGRRPGWQHAPGDQGDRDLKFVDAMLAWARGRYPIDPARVYAAGHSNGGAMTYVLWSARARTFAAFAPSSAVFRESASATPRPAFIVAGEQDALVRFAWQRASLDGVLRLNQAAREATPWAGGAAIHRSTIGADVVAYIHPGGHAMPADAGALIAKFFRERPAR